MNRRETYAVERIDRCREHDAAAEARTARTRTLEAIADTVVDDAVLVLPDTERLPFVKMLTAKVRAVLVKHHGEASAAAILSREAYEAGRNLMPRTDARDKAGQVFK